MTQQTGDTSFPDVAVYFTKSTSRTHRILEAFRSGGLVGRKMNFLYGPPKYTLFYRTDPVTGTWMRFKTISSLTRLVCVNFMPELPLSDDFSSSDHLHQPTWVVLGGRYRTSKRNDVIEMPTDYSVDHFPRQLVPVC